MCWCINKYLNNIKDSNICDRSYEYVKNSEVYVKEFETKQEKYFKKKLFMNPKLMIILLVTLED